MNSQDIAKELYGFTQPCIKKKINYNLIKCENRITLNKFKELTKTPFTIIPYECVPDKFKNKVFKTKLPGDKFIEQKFILKEDESLVVGSVCELYNVKLNKQFKQYKENIYVPISETRRCIKINKKIYDKFVVKERIPTSWGAYHFCKIGDYLIVRSDGVYRIKKEVFEKTYQIK